MSQIQVCHNVTNSISLSNVTNSMNSHVHLVDGPQALLQVFQLLGDARRMVQRGPHGGSQLFTQPSIAVKREGAAGLQIRISVNLNFELHRTSELFPAIFKRCCILEKSRKNLAKIWPKFSKNSAKFGKVCENLQKKQQNFQQFLTKFLRLENGAKECIV